MKKNKPNTTMSTIKQGTLGVLIASAFLATPSFAQFGPSPDNRDNRNGWNERDNRSDRNERGNLGERYRTYLVDRNNNSIEDFKIVARNFRPGNTIDFFVDAEPNARSASVSFSTGRTQRNVVLRKDGTDRFLGSYKISPTDNLSENTQFDLKLANRRGINSYAKLVPAGGRYAGNEQDYLDPNNRDWRNERNNRGPQYGQNNPGQDRNDRNYQSPANNPNFGEVVNVTAAPNNSQQGVNVPGAAIGAIAGGILGNQVGKGSGNTAATILGAVGGGIAGNHIGKNMNPQNSGSVWVVDVKFNDGSTQRYQYPQNPQVNIGQKVQKDPNAQGGLSIR